MVVVVVVMVIATMGGGHVAWERRNGKMEEKRKER